MKNLPIGMIKVSNSKKIDSNQFWFPRIIREFDDSDNEPMIYWRGNQ